MADHLHALPVDHLLGDYRIKRIIGSGGFGITYYAQDIKLDKPVAIKEYLPNELAVRTDATTIKPKSTADHEGYQWGLERFLDEARALARFKHPHINEVHRFFEANGTAYLVLEYVDGETLSDLLKREQRLNNDRLHRLLRELLSGLAEVHEAGYVHRDIKPGNIMLRKDGAAVLLDFGAARQAIGQRSKSITSILTPGYAPIEQYDQQSDDIGPWTDLYALGMVAYRCISGPHGNPLIDAVARARFEQKGEQNKDMVAAVKVGKDQYDDFLLKAIDQAIKVDEKERPQSVAAMVSAISPVPAATPRQPLPAQAPPSHSSRDWLTPMLILIIVIGAAVWSWPLFEEFVSWRTVQCDDAMQLESHLARYPDGRYKQTAEGCLAQIKLKDHEKTMLTSTEPISTAVEETQYWAELQCDDKTQMQAYLERYPSGLNQQTAQDCIVKTDLEAEKQYWAELQCNDKTQMQAYLEQYPSGLNQQAAQDCIVNTDLEAEKQYWAALQCDDKTQMQAYLERYPSGLNQPAAQDCIVKTDLEAEKQYWAELQCDDKTQMQAYLEQYPSGLNQQAAQDCIVKTDLKAEKQYWAELQCNNKTQMQAYLEQYPSGLNRPAAQDCIVKTDLKEEKQYWAELQCDDKAQMQAYLGRYPGGLNRQTAQDCIATIKQQEDHKRKEAQAAQAKENANKKDSKGQTPLHHAAWTNDHKKTALLITQGANVNAKNNNGETPLQRAVWQNAIETATLLIKNEANINATDLEGYTSMHIAVQRETQAIATLLIENGADINVKIDNGITLLHYAAWQDSLEIAALLIEHGVDANIRDDKGETPLHRATRHNAGEIAALLIENGANINAENNIKWTPLDLAIFLKQSNSEQVIRAAGGLCNHNC